MCFHLFKLIGGEMSKPYYQNKFFAHISSFENFMSFIKYHEVTENIAFERDTPCLSSTLDDRAIVNGKCADSCGKYPCTRVCPYSNIDFKSMYQRLCLDDLKKIYDSVKSYEYDTKRVCTGMFNNRPEYPPVSGENLYVRNCNGLSRKIYTLIQRIILPQIQLEQKIELQKKQEEEKKNEFEKTQKLLKEAHHVVKIINLFKSRNPFQNNSPSIRIEFEVKETGEVFADYITLSDRPFLQYKLARFLIATETESYICKDIFDKYFEEFKNIVLNKEIVIDLKK